MQGSMILKRKTLKYFTRRKLLTDGRTDRRTDGRKDKRTESGTPISHPAISRCDKNKRAMHQLSLISEQLFDENQRLGLSFKRRLRSAQASAQSD